jgi:hypothetical protein
MQRAIRGLTARFYFSSCEGCATRNHLEPTRLIEKKKRGKQYARAAPESNGNLPHCNALEILCRVDVHPAPRDLVVLSLRGWLDAIIWSLPRKWQKRGEKSFSVVFYVPPPSRTGFFRITFLCLRSSESGCAPCTAGLRSWML